MLNSENHAGRLYIQRKSIQKQAKPQQRQNPNTTFDTRKDNIWSKQVRKARSLQAFSRGRLIMSFTF